MISKTISAIFLLAFFAIPSAASIYEKGEPCGTNTNCQKECYANQFAVGKDKSGNFQLVCALEDTNKDNYTCFKCKYDANAARRQNVAALEDALDEFQKWCKETKEFYPAGNVCVLSIDKDLESVKRACKSIHGGVGSASKKQTHVTARKECAKI